MWVVVVRLLFDCFWVNLKWKECRRTIQMRWEEPTTPPSLMANYYCENLKAIRITKTEISMRNRYGRLAIIFGNFWIRLEKIEHPYKSSGFICRQALRACRAWRNFPRHQNFSLVFDFMLLVDTCACCQKRWVGPFQNILLSR